MKFKTGNLNLGVYEATDILKRKFDKDLYSIAEARLEIKKLIRL
jgi:hypothetical protein